jgi:oligoribonuclease
MGYPLFTFDLRLRTFDMSSPRPPTSDAGPDETGEEIRFVWIDLEMTGLNPDVDRILEIAVVVTGPDLRPLGQVHRVIGQAEHSLEKMSKVVQQMHTRNGLIAEVLASPITMREAERAALALVVEHCLPGDAFLCGNSVHHDWRFLARHMPRLEQYLHYRQVDVSTIKVLVQAWAPSITYDKQISNHRALPDIHASIAELRFYCEKVFGADLRKLAEKR